MAASGSGVHIDAVVAAVDRLEHVEVSTDHGIDARKGIELWHRFIGGESKGPDMVIVDIISVYTRAPAFTGPSGHENEQVSFLHHPLTNLRENIIERPDMFEAMRGEDDVCRLRQVLHPMLENRPPRPRPLKAHAGARHPRRGYGGGRPSAAEKEQFDQMRKDLGSAQT